MQRFLWEMPVSAFPIGAEREDGAAPSKAGDGAPALVVRDLRRKYGPREVLRGVNLTLEPGQSVLVSGANGAGKTTLLRCVTGVIAPHEGSISLFGLDPEKERRACQRRIGYLPAGDRAVYARLTVRKNLDFWARIAFVPRRERAAAVDSALRAFGLDELSDRRADRLSMGQRQRVRLAMAFLHSPDLVLLDEPDTSLDPDGVQLLREAADEALARGAACLWCGPTGARETVTTDLTYAFADGVLERA
jgi:ABC-2 type transport system ATP-binding protein